MDKFSLLLAGTLFLLPAVAWGPIQPRENFSTNFVSKFVFRDDRHPEADPREFVAATARRHGVPAPLAMAVWQMEASLRTHPPEGADGERGAFQVGKDVATRKDIACDWSRMEEWEISVDCGMRVLAHGLRVGGTPMRAADYYNQGHFHRKVWAYAQDVGRLMLKYQGEGR